MGGSDACDGSGPHHITLWGDSWLGRFPLRPEIDVFLSLAEEAAEEFSAEPGSSGLGWLALLYENMSAKRSTITWDSPDTASALRTGDSVEIAWLPEDLFLASAKAVELLAHGQMQQQALRERTRDDETDSQESKVRRVPENLGVFRLAKRIKRELPKGGTKLDIARDYAEGDEKKAQNLLRRLRRYPHLLE